MKEARKSDTHSVIFVFKKWKSLLPFLIVGATFLLTSLLTTNIIHQTIEINWPNIILQTFFFIFPISMFRSNYVIWFIATLLVGCLIYFPIAKKTNKIFPIIAFVVSIFIYAYIYSINPTIDIQSKKIYNILPYGYLRAIAGLGLGCFIEWLTKTFPISINKNVPNILIDILIILCLCLFIFICINKPKSRYELLSIILMFAISWALNNQIGYINTKGWEWTKVFANFSTIFYLIHPSFIILFNLSNLPPILYLISLLITTILSSIILLFAIKFMKQGFSKLSKIWNDNKS